MLRKVPFWSISPCVYRQNSQLERCSNHFSDSFGRRILGSSNSDQQVTPGDPPSSHDQWRAILRVGKEPRAASQPREPPIPSPSLTLIRPLAGESPGLQVAPTEANALRAVRRLIARIKCEACGGVRAARKWGVLNADDAQIIEEDTAAHYERDLALFRGWHHKRGTNPEAALEELRRRTESHARGLAQEHGRGREAGRRDGRAD